MTLEPRRAFVGRPERVMVERTDDFGRRYSVPRAEWMAWAAEHSREEFDAVLRALRSGERRPAPPAFATARDRAVLADDRAALERWRRGEPETREAWEHRWRSTWDSARAVGDEAHCERVLAALGHAPRRSTDEPTHTSEVIE